MIRALLISITLAGAAAAQAQGLVGVRSGDHGSFSRLVLLYAERPTWRFGRVEGGYEFRSDGEEEFDVGSVFELIGRNRIADLRTRAPGRLFLAVDCECNAQVFELRRGGIVIDIRDGPPGPGARFEATLPPDRDETAGSSDGAQPDPPGAPGNETAARLELPVDLPAPPPPDLPLDETLSPEAAELREALLQELGRAAAQGLVTVDVPEPLPIRPPEPRSEPPAPAPPQPEAPRPRSNIRVLTAVDRDRPSPGAVPDLSEDGAPCVTAEALDIANWGSLDKPGALIGTKRARLFGEFDRLSEDGLRALVRGYIYLGFGIEARVALGLRQSDDPGDAMLLALARIMDGEPAREEWLLDQGSCDTPVALWSALADPATAPVRPINRSAMLATFSGLPAHLRRHLGPRLAAEYVEAGDLTTADTLRNAIDRAGGDHGPAFTLLEAEMHRARGDTQEAESALDELAGEDNETGQAALLSFIAGRIEAGKPVDEGQIENAFALAFERRGSRDAARLTSAAIRALLTNGAIDRALEEINRARKANALSPTALDALVSRALERSAEIDDDAQFLARALTHDAPDMLDTMARRAIATRLVALGFAEEAGRFGPADTAAPTKSSATAAPPNASKDRPAGARERPDPGRLPPGAATAEADGTVQPRDSDTGVSTETLPVSVAGDDRAQPRAGDRGTAQDMAAGSSQNLAPSGDLSPLPAFDGTLASAAALLEASRALRAGLNRQP